MLVLRIPPRQTRVDYTWVCLGGMRKRGGGQTAQCWCLTPTRILLRPETPCDLAR